MLNFFNKELIRSGLGFPNICLGSLFVAVFNNAIKDPEKYPWIFSLKDAKINSENPIVINASIRAKLNAFKDKDPTTTIWSWFVQCTRKITENDFKILTSF